MSDGCATMESLRLTDLQAEALCEIFNVGIGQAANALSEMIGDEVELAVPELKCLSIEQALKQLEIDAPLRLSAVRQRFNGIFSGDALLIFPHNDSLELVRNILGIELSLDQLSDLEEDALIEVGNVILNACFCSISDMLGCELIGDIPRHFQGPCREIMATDTMTEVSIVIELSMRFCIPGHNVKGMISFVMTLPELQNFLETVDDYLSPYNR